MLAKYLEREGHSAGRRGGLLRGKVVLELGAGTGLVSLVAARLGAAGVAATDLAHGMDLLKHNAGRNLPPAANTEPELEPRVTVRGPAGELVAQLTPLVQLAHLLRDADLARSV